MLLLLIKCILCKFDTEQKKFLETPPPTNPRSQSFLQEGPPDVMKEPVLFVFFFYAYNGEIEYSALL